MATPVWAPGTLYPPGSLVVPRSLPPTLGAPIANADFESGDTGWTKGGNWQINNNPGYRGAWCAQFPGTGTGELVSGKHQVAPGTRINGACYGKPSTGSDAVRCRLYWFNDLDVQIAQTDGDLIQGSGGWRQSRVSGTAPASATKVAIGASTTKSSGTVVSVDTFSWDYQGAVPTRGLMYKAVQAAAGYSNTTEPTWPNVLGQTVVDNEVTWEAVSESRITWKAIPILVSGATEPDWPTVGGGFVADGSISWQAISRRVEDPNCPNSKVVAIIASKVFAADKDIIRFSATANPLDWSSEENAGYLASGLQQSNSNDMAVLNAYRNNLVAFNASSFQNWQVDPDPAEMAILDQMDGIGSTWQKAAQPVANDLLYLSQLGVRSIGIAAGAQNLAAGDVGTPIDSIIKDAIKTALWNGTDPLATYYPSAGQYWLTFPDFPPPDIDIVGQFSAWTTLTDYQSTVSFQNNVGAVSASWAGGYPRPDGATLTVNNETQTVTLFIPLGSVLDDFCFDLRIVDSMDRSKVEQRCIAVNLPPITISGSFPDGNAFEAYEGRLQVANSIGPFTAEIIASDPPLPPGHTIEVDPDTNEIVLRIPAHA